MTDAYGAGTSTAQSFLVAPAFDAPPVAQFTYSCVGTTCTFDASGSTDDKGIGTYRWDLNVYPSSVVTGQQVTQTYPHGGYRTVALTVLDTKGQKGGTVQYVLVP